MSGDSCDLLCLDLPKAEALRARRLEVEDGERLAERGRALGDATRIELLRALRAGGALCVCDLAWVVERSDKLVSHHARRLRSAGLVSSRRDGKMVLYELTAVGERLLDALVVGDGVEVEA